MSSALGLPQRGDEHRYWVPVLTGALLRLHTVSAA